MTENVGEVEITATLDTDQIGRQATQAGNEAGRDFDRALGREINRSGGFQRALRQIENQGREGMRRTARGMTEELERNDPFRTLRRNLRSSLDDVQSGLTRFRQIALGAGAALGPVVVPLLALLAEIGPALAVALPALAAVAAGVAVIALSMDALSNAFEPLVEGFKSLQEPIGAILTQGVRPLVRELTAGLIPVLEGGLGAFARVMNEALRSLLRFIGGAQGLRLIRQILFGLAEAIRPLGRLLVPLVRALLTITRAAIPGFETLNLAIEQMVLSFDAWIQRLAQSGDLQRNITASVNTLITAFTVLGNAFIGVIQGLRILAGIFAPIVQALESVGVSMRDFARIMTVAVGLFFTLIGPVLLLASVLGSLGSALAGIGTAISFLVSPVGLILVAVAALAAGIFLLWRNSEQFRTAVTNLGVVLLNLAQTVWPILLEAGRNLAIMFRDEFLPAAQRLAAEVGDNLAPAIDAVSRFITDKLVPSIPIVVEQFRQWWPAIRRVVVFFLQMAAVIIRVSSFVVGRLIPAAIQAGQILGIALVRNVQTLITIFRVLQAVGRAVAGVARTVGAAFQTTGRFAVDLYNGIKRLAGIFRGALSSGIRTARSVLSSIAGVFDTIEGAIRTVISAVEDLISALGRIRVPDINLPSIGDIPGIPGGKMGAIVDRPALWLVGEGPWREAIIPDPKAQPKRALQLSRELGLDKFILSQQPPASQSALPERRASETPANVVNAVFNIYEAGNGRAVAGQVDARLRLMMGGF